MIKQNECPICKYPLEDGYCANCRKNVDIKVKKVEFGVARAKIKPIRA
jgi:hypothetical protein